MFILNRLAVFVLMYIGIGVVVIGGLLAYAFTMMGRGKSEVVDNLNDDFCEIYNVSKKQMEDTTNETSCPMIIIWGIVGWPMIAYGLIRHISK